jgi:hypothetical protein
MGLEEIGRKICLCSWISSNDNEFPSLAQNAAKSPRGIRGFKLDTGGSVKWKVQGKVGGYTKCAKSFPSVVNSI